MFLEDLLGSALRRRQLLGVSILERFKMAEENPTIWLKIGEPDKHGVLSAFLKPPKGYLRNRHPLGPAKGGENARYQRCPSFCRGRVPFPRSVERETSSKPPWLGRLRLNVPKEVV